ncbi:hypothetical protein SAMN05443245_7713 [Paraburkholderia fungorum]|uniref:DUF4148 domain-containing protein n=1 Tax=Paraburkholderia fungorum TaxID=134537 RepID=A0A1H1JZY3_9BURK|nr:hypothetical protein SAMN05443245_7713 [Paraburkholderia fungorum]
MIRSAYVAIAVTCMACATSAFAQETNEKTDASSNATRQDSNAVSDSGLGMEANGQSAAGGRAELTRAQVERELSRAERSGELQTLYSTVYKGS